MAGWRVDFRQTARGLTRSPLFSGVAVLVLAFGIGAGTAIFGVVDHILFRPLPFPEEHRLLTLCETHERLGGHCVASPPNVMDWRARSAMLEEVGLARWWHYTLETGEEARGLSVAISTAGYLRALGMRPLLGRLLHEEDLRPSAPRVAILSEAFWRGEVGADRTVLGRTLTLDGEPFTVVGVLQGDVGLPELAGAALWLPLHFSPTEEERREWRGFMTVARMREGVTRRQVEEEIRGIHSALAEEYPAANVGWGIEVRRLRDEVVGDVRPMLLVFFGSVAMLLIIVCANLAGLLLVRATTRQRDLTVRAALGAGRTRLARVLLMEAGLLSLAGGLLAVPVAWGATRLFIGMAPPGIPRLASVGLDARVLGFAVLATFAVGLTIGVLPALRATTVDLGAALREARPSGSRRTARLRAALVVAEVALSVALIAGTGMLVRSLTGLLRWEPGFDTEHVLLLTAFAPGGSYARDQLPPLWRRAEEALSSLPGIRAVGTVSAGPLFGGRETDAVLEVDGRALEGAPATVRWYDAGPGYFAALGIPLLDGRDLNESDVYGGPPVAVVNQTLARRLWPRGSAVGRRIRLGELGNGDPHEVVGVVADVPPFYRGSAPDAEIWWSNRQSPRWATFFVLRTSVDPASVVGPASDALKAVDPRLEPGVRTLGEAVRSNLVRPRFSATLVGAFALVALILAVVGVYGMMAYSVALRRHEIGIRLALGADRRRVVRGILEETLSLGGLGAVLGLVLALHLGDFLARMLHGVSPTDPVSLLAAASAVALTAGAAGLAPALRASRTDPITALRSE